MAFPGFRQRRRGPAGPLLVVAGLLACSASLAAATRTSARSGDRSTDQTSVRTLAQPPMRLDAGSFTVLLNGQRVGREQFSVQRLVPVDGATLEVRSESAIGDRRTAMRLEADSAGTPVRYSVEERQGTEVTLRLGGQRVRGRFATLARSVTGESAREYLLRPQAVVVEDDGFVQHALLLWGRRLAPGDGVTLPSLTPVANAQGAVRIVLEAEADPVVIAGARRVARRWRVVTASGELRLVWTEPEGPLLRVQIPARGLEAVRDDVPR
ncbi:MAG: hypothetical protein IBJ19_04520 [Gemmatimonadaceae bacterium]|nr:hypothetical protein [Gemmatimonadaceae bacterium]